ncbi:remorin [Eucalyptus grandis]|uniref:Uncharacterized protein n=2 Tax=Eucalyptus grandis TaxID=71139 RepID=A0ACC3M7Q9_EUCGR|nr:remorin [Eucalyptus grandis]KAK3447218.1 hypothetical protein EUGRSUZ_A02793 [Eucalyptus grandis]
MSSHPHLDTVPTHRSSPLPTVQLSSSLFLAFYNISTSALSSLSVFVSSVTFAPQPLPGDHLPQRLPLVNSAAMAEEEPKTVQPQAPSEPPPAETPKDVAEEKPLIPPPPEEEKQPTAEPKALAVVEKPAETVKEKVEPAETVKEKVSEGSGHRDRELARVETEKKMSLIRAWEESEKCKAENKAHKKLSAIGAWENSKKASVEAELKKIEEKLEKQKAEYVEKMKNKIAAFHKAAEEKRALIEAKRGEDILKAEELAAKYRAKGTTPKKLLSIF